MNFKDKMQRFNKRWEIKESEPYKISFEKFKTRILNILSDIDQHITENSVSLFCQFYGIEEKWTYEPYGNRKWGENIINRMVQEVDEIEFYKLLEVIFSLDISGVVGYGGRTEYSKDIVYSKVCQAIEFSNVNLATTKSAEEGIIFYPRGEQFLDENLINGVLSFLDKVSNKHFVEALNFYSDKKWIKAAESLRRALEEFLKFKLKNHKGLEANIKELQTALKKDKRDPQIRNIIFQTFSYLDQYFNENSKHVDGEINDTENEFLIYQTGILMRYINRTIHI
jgi:hypothetical protein